MKVNEILALINAGYTKEEIAAFSKAQEEPEKKEPEKKEPEKKEPEKKEPEKKEPEKKEPESIADPVKELAGIVAGLAEQVKAMQADNIAAARQEEQKKETSESVIKSFFDKI